MTGSGCRYSSKAMHTAAHVETPVAAERLIANLQPGVVTSQKLI